MDLRRYGGKPQAVIQLRECDKIDGQPNPIIGLPGVRLIFRIEGTDARILHVWYPDLPPPNNTRDIPPPS